MTTEYKVVMATQEHVKYLAEHMRQRDIDEVWASSRRTPEEAISLSMLGSRDTMSGLADGRVVCMFGVADHSFMGDSGAPWLLATDEVNKHAKAFLRLNKVYIDYIKGEYRILRNYVDARNVEAIRWLEWLGFNILPALPIGADGLLFHPFEMVN